MSNPWNSECVSPHMCFGGTPEEEGLFLPEHFLFRLLLLCLLIVRALCRVMIKGQYRNFIILHNDSCSPKPGSHVCLKPPAAGVDLAGKMLDAVELWVLVLCRPDEFFQHQTGQQSSLWIWLWGQEHCHVEAGKRQTQTADTELEEVIVCCSI